MTRETIQYKDLSVRDPAPYGAAGAAWQANFKELADRIGPCNFTATAPPTATDDTGDGYAVGSLWYDTVAKTLYWCASATAGAADWLPIQIPTLGTLATQSADAVDITGGTIAGAQRIRGSVRQATARVTIMFDDGHESAWTVAKPILDAAGVVGCIAMPSDFVGKEDYLSASQLTTLESTGWEIVSHSTDGTALTSLTEAQATAAIGGAKSALQALGLTIENFVYPSHAQNATIRRIARQYYRSARGTLALGGVNPLALDTYALRSVLATEFTAEQLQGYVDAANTAGAWLIVYWHQLEPGGAEATKLTDLIGYIQAAGTSVVTMSDALDACENLIDVGDGFSAHDGAARIPLLEGSTKINGNLRVDGNLGLRRDPAYSLDSLAYIDGAPAMRLTGLTTYCGMRVDSQATSPTSRNYFLGSNVNAYGDFTLRKSATLGGDPASGTDILYMAWDGKVGIGTINPASPLTVNGEIAIPSDTVGLKLDVAGTTTIISNGTIIACSKPLKAAGYQSSDGTAGATADVAVAKAGGGTRTLHYKDGLYTGYTDS